MGWRRAGKYVPYYDSVVVRYSGDTVRTDTLSIPHTPRPPTEGIVRGPGGR